MGVDMYLRWLSFLPASLAFDIFGRLLTPLVVLFADKDGWLPSCGGGRRRTTQSTATQVILRVGARQPPRLRPTCAGWRGCGETAAMASTLT